MHYRDPFVVHDYVVARIAGLPSRGWLFVKALLGGDAFEGKAP